LPAAIDHHLAFRRPGGEHAAEQIVPAIFVQLDRARICPRSNASSFRASTQSTLLPHASA
jgi:hypothetical protein